MIIQLTVQYSTVQYSTVHLVHIMMSVLHTLSCRLLGGVPVHIQLLVRLLQLSNVARVYTENQGQSPT